MSLLLSAGLKREDNMKIREKALESLRIKGAFSAQELYDGHLSKYFCSQCVTPVFVYISNI